MPYGLALSASLTVAFVPLSMAVAQESSAAADEATEEVVITGSRIARGFGLRQPLARGHRRPRCHREIRLRATSSSSWRKCPSNGNGAFSTRGNNQDSTANGSSPSAFAASARMRRSCSSMDAGSPSTPLRKASRPTSSTSTPFPVAAIERVEILKDGSSAVYGSDAVAGVVNIILRDNFQGSRRSVGYGNVTGRPVRREDGLADLGHRVTAIRTSR